MLTHSVAALLAAMAVWFGKGVISPTPSQPPATDTTVSAPPVVAPNSTSTTPPSTPSGVAFLSDSFTQYKNTAALLANVSNGIGGTATSQTALYNDGYSNTGALIAIDTAVKYHGHQTLRYTFPGGTGAYPGLASDWSPSRKIIWYKVALRFSPGWTTTGTLTNSANAYKVLGWLLDTYDGSGRLEITNTNQYQLYWNAALKNVGTVVGGSAIMPGTTGYGNAGNITTEWTDGGWYVYVIEMDFSGTTAGIATVWMAKDGQPLVKRATIAPTMQSGNVLPGIIGVMLGMNFNQVRAANQTQYIWYGGWEVIDGVAHKNPFSL